MARMNSLLHPGQVLREEYMEPLRLDTAALAHALAVPADRIVPLIDDEAPLSSDLALRLARCFKTSPQFWLGLPGAYDLAKARINYGAEIESQVIPLAA